MRRQCELLGISRALIYSLPKGEPTENLKIMREIDELHMEDASAGSRRMRSYLRRRKKEKGTKALVIFIGDNAETISRHIRVSGRQHSFRWDESSFRSQGKPYLHLLSSF